MMKPITGLQSPINSPARPATKIFGLICSAATAPQTPAQIIGLVVSPPPVTAPAATPVTIVAELTGSNQACAFGVVGEGHAPVLDLCRKLIGCGVDPNAALRCYRGTTWALKVRSIGEAAALEVSQHGTGFVPRHGRRAASPMRQNLVEAARERLRPHRGSGTPSPSADVGDHRDRGGDHG